MTTSLLSGGRLLLSLLLIHLAWFITPVAGNPASISGGRISVSLPQQQDPGSLNQLEWSTDLINWEPVARDYGFEWENTNPHRVAIEPISGGQVFTREIDGETRYFRVIEHPAASLGNKEAVSRFLQQATFGPTRAMINQFPGLETETGFNDPPYTYFEQWIDEQVSIPLFSLRAFFRERSNPAFVDNVSADSPYEIGHNPDYGHQLSYNIGNVTYHPDSADALAAGRFGNDVQFSAARTKQIVWYQAAVTADDALRQRVAWALSQLFVVGENGSNQLPNSERFLSYYDIFVRNAFGNFRDILGEVTFHPAMGYYLTFVDNKAFHVEGTFPDENYARELMQLFTIGLWELNMDGSLKLNENNDPIATYDNENIVEFSKVFTGLRKQPARNNLDYAGAPNYIDPMRMQASWHDFSAKTLLDGSVSGPFPENQAGGTADVNALLDHLFNHPNTAPFVARILIQRLAISNPSPQYIEAVSTAFTTGYYNGSGTGQRGDMLAVIKAILLHPEARTPALAYDDAHGKLREPLARLMSYARAFQLTSLQTYGLLPFDQLNEVFAQSPFQSPSVFNFYQAEYQPLGKILERDIYAPEFQIHTDITSLGLANAIRTLVHDGITDAIGARDYSQGDLDLTYETTLAGFPYALVDYLDLILCGGRLTDQNRAILIDLLESMPDSTIEEKLARAQRALSLFALLPEFNVIY